MSIRTIGRPKGYQYPVGLSTILVTLGTNSNVILEYTSSNTWVAPDNVTEVEYLVVAGGGGAGGTGGSGGGGAGGLLYASGHPIVSGNTYTVTVGAGGSGGAVTLSSSELLHPKSKTKLTPIIRLSVVFFMSWLLLISDRHDRCHKPCWFSHSVQKLSQPYGKIGNFQPL